MSSHPPKSNKVLAPEGIRALTHHLGIKKPFLCYTLSPHPVRKGEYKKVPWSQWEGTETKSALKKLDYWNACWQRVQFGEYSGVGIALFGGLIGFDFDYCLDDDRELISTHPYALLVRKLMKTGAYMEVSPSGRGLHAFGYIDEGCPQEAYIKKDNSHTKIEVYVQGRFFTLTGDVWKGCDGLEPADLTKHWMALNEEREEKRERDRSHEKGNQGLDLDEDELALRKRSVKRDLGKALRDIPPDEYHTWVACRHALIDFGLEFDCMDEARDMWLTWSSGSNSFRGDEVEGPKWDADVPKTEARGPEERRHYQWIFEEVKEHRGSSKREDDYGEDEDDEEEKGWPLETDCKPSRDKLAEWEALSATPIIASLLYPDIAQTVAPGGIGKTTFGLLLMIHIILGKAFCGHAIERPGPCVYVTREDSEGFMNSKLFKLMDDMSLSKKDQQRVCEGMRIVDVSALVNAKLVRAGKYGVLQVTDFADYIIEEFGPLEPSLVVFDPAMRFGPGESKVNDGEDMVVQTGVKIKAALNCCVMFMHHTGKAQMGRTDQYAGRNGSAFSDGCRMVFVLGAYKWNAPNGWPCDPLKPGQSGLAIHRPKNSYVPGEECEPIYLVRTGFGFTQTLPLVRDAEPQSRIDPNEADENAIYELVLEKGPLSRNRIVELSEIPDKRTKDAIKRLEENGAIVRNGDKQNGGFVVAAPEEAES